MMKILVLGDVGASESNMQAFCDADKDLFSKEIQELCAGADLVLLNLEKPLTDVTSPLGKCPPDYIAPTETINGIKLLHPKLVTLANNHIMDQRVQGLHSTMDILSRNGIWFVGAGNNLEEARKPLVVTEQGIRVGIYACCEKEFSFATETKPGANVFDPLETFDDIEELRKACDYLIVLFHGGMQGYPYPTPYQQRVCRKMCDKGADLVVCQHSHIIGCKEKYKGNTIVYGQGNFLLDETSAPFWKSGLIMEISINQTDDKVVRYIPVQTVDHKVCIHQDTKLILNEFCKRNNEVHDSEKIVRMYQQMCREKVPEYLVKLSGMSRFFQRVMRRLGITKYYTKIKYSKRECNLIIDYLYCISHREAIETGLSVVYNSEDE